MYWYLIVLWEKIFVFVVSDCLYIIMIIIICVCCDYFVLDFNVFNLNVYEFFWIIILSNVLDGVGVGVCYCVLVSCV